MPDSTKPVASSNWLALKKTLKKKSPSDSTTSSPSYPHRRKRRKLDHAEGPIGSIKSISPAPSMASMTTHATNTHNEPSSSSTTSPSLESLRNMVRGSLSYTPSQSQPGKYLAIDCEMVGIGLEGTESSLARVSLVNWYGAIQLDVFIRQRERVVDYRTQWSGIREKDMLGAKPFEDIQKQVADLIKDRILVGHAVHHDLKALLLSHPRPLLRDTQVYAHKFKLTKSKYIALRHLVKSQIGVTIQEGEHNSITDARATMAIYRLHKKEWERGVRPIEHPTTNTNKKRKHSPEEDEGRVVAGVTGSSLLQGDEPDPSVPSSKTKQNPKQKPRKGISTGLSTIIKRREAVVGGDFVSRGSKSKSTVIQIERGGKRSKPQKAWWTELPNSVGTGAKGSLRLKKS